MLLFENNFINMLVNLIDDRLVVTIVNLTVYDGLY